MRGDSFFLWLLAWVGLLVGTFMTCWVFPPLALICLGFGGVYLILFRLVRSRDARQEEPTAEDEP
jgi:hypothetical protein